MDRTSVGPQAAEAELALFEGLRAGEAAAFERLAAEHLPGLRAFAGCYVPPSGVEPRVLRAVAAFLAGVDVFAWRCTLRAWLYGLLADACRGAAAPAAGVPAPAAAASSLRPAAVDQVGPADWSDLPWGARWGDRPWAAAGAALDALPVEVREVLWLRDVAGWPVQEAWDAVGCTHGRGEALLAVGRSRVRDALAALVGAPAPDPAIRARQTTAAARLLAELAPPPGPAEVPPELRRLFARWRRRRWRARLRTLGRPRVVGGGRAGAVGPARPPGALNRSGAR